MEYGKKEEKGMKIRKYNNTITIGGMSLSDRDKRNGKRREGEK